MATKVLFPTGQLLSTPGALKAMVESGDTPATFLDRHLRGDWGSMCAEDKRLNDESLKDGSRLMSAYELVDGQKIWIITEAADDNGERLATTILLPEEY